MSDNRPIEWPVFVFDDGYYPMVAYEEKDIPLLFEEGYWDEFGAAFDSNFHPLMSEVKDSERILVMVGDSNIVEFERLARTGLALAWKSRRFFNRRPSPSDLYVINSMEAQELKRQIMARNPPASS